MKHLYFFKFIIDFFSYKLIGIRQLCLYFFVENTTTFMENRLSLFRQNSEEILKFEFYKCEVKILLF